MPSANRPTTPAAFDDDLVEARYAQLGDRTVAFETFKADIDVSPLYRGLPGDRCPAPHLGVVTAGQITFSWPDREETYVEGDAYVAPGGHHTFVAGGTSIVEFTATAELEPVLDAIRRNLAVTS